MADGGRTVVVVTREPAERMRSRPTPAGQLIDGLFDRLGIRERIEKARTVSKWEQVAGPHIARVTRPAGIRGGTLFVEVSGAAWMTELSMMRHTLLGRLNEDRDCGRIERIMFVQSEHGGPASPNRGGRITRGRG